MNLKFIIGEAGTAKTTTLCRIQDTTKMSTVALAFTHSACNNMISKGMKNVKTLHSFFRIIPNSSYINITYLPQMLLIDEFSLIPTDILISIFDGLKDKEITVVCAGDLLQLPPIVNTKLIDITTLNLTGECSLEDAKEIFYTLGRTIYPSPYYQNANKMILKKNYRSDTNIMNLLYEILETGELNTYNNINEIKSDDCVFIASTYENLKKMRVEDKDGFPTRIGIVKITQNNYLLTENVNEEFHNGDIVNVIKYEPNNIIGDVLKIEKDNKTVYLKKNVYRTFDILPNNYRTIHYAQGRGYKNIVMCVDDLFEIGMLYTGITRAIESIKFITFKNIKSVKDIVKRFKILKANIYG